MQTLSDLDARDIRVVHQLLMLPPAGVGEVASGRWDVLRAGDRLQGDPSEYRLVAVPDVELGDDVVAKLATVMPGVSLDDLRTNIERMAQVALLMGEGKGATPAEQARTGPVVAKHRAVVLPDAGGDMFQTQVAVQHCELLVDTVDGVEQVVGRVQGEPIVLQRLQAVRDVRVNDWSPELPGTVPVRLTYLLPPEHPIALLLARATGVGMTLDRVPSETAKVQAFTHNASRTPVGSRKPRDVTWTSTRAKGLPPNIRDPGAVDIIVELDPVSRDMAFRGPKGKGVRKGDYGFYLPFDERRGSVADLDRLVQECLQTMGNLPFQASMDAMMSAAMKRRGRVVPVDWRIIANARYGGTNAVNSTLRKQLLSHLDAMQRFGLHLKIGDQVKAAKLFVVAATDVPTGDVAVMALNPLLFRPDQFGIGLPEGLLRLDVARHPLTVRLGRYFAGRFSMTDDYRLDGSFDVDLGTMMLGAGVDLTAKLRHDGRPAVERELRRALTQLRDGVDAFPGRMLAGFNIARKGDDISSWKVSIIASDLYLDALPFPRKLTENRQVQGRRKALPSS